MQALRAAGGVISPKSTLELITRMVWLGKDVDLGGAGNSADSGECVGGDAGPLVAIVCRGP